MIYFAPFQGITGPVFRKVFCRHFSGINKFYTPYFAQIQNEGKLPKNKHIALGNVSENGCEIIPQILSKDAAELVRFISICRDLGFREVNWNLGCPYPQVAGKKRGSGLLPLPDLVDEILDGVFTALPDARFSVKTRLGYSNDSEIDALTGVFNRYPLHEVTIHPRIGKQLYTGTTNRERFGETAQKLTTPVCYNGDIYTSQDYTQVRTAFPQVDRFMIGRGLLIDPGLAETILYGRRTTAEKLKPFLNDLLVDNLRFNREVHTTLNRMKELWNYLSLGFADGSRIMRVVGRSRTPDEYEEAVKRVFGELKYTGFISMRSSQSDDQYPHE